MPGGTTNPWVGAADLWEAGFGLQCYELVFCGLWPVIRASGLLCMEAEVIANCGLRFIGDLA